MSHRIFIVEDHPVVLGGYLAFIRREPDMEVCGVATSGEEALEQILSCNPDVTLVDVSLQGEISGIDLLRQLQEQRPELAVLVISGNDAAVYADAVMKTGARGYLAKGDAAEFIPAIRRVLAGEVYIGPDMKKWQKQDW